MKGAETMSEIHEAYVTDVISSLRWICIVMNVFLFVCLYHHLYSNLTKVYCIFYWHYTEAVCVVS